MENNKRSKGKKLTEIELLANKLDALESSQKEFNSDLQASENSLKSYFERRIETYFVQITEKLSALIDKKYADIHDQSYYSKSTGPSKEDIKRVIELACSKTKIEALIKRYTSELSLIRLFNLSYITIIQF